MNRIIKYPKGSTPPGEGWHLRENDDSTPEGYSLWQKSIDEDLAKDATASDYIDDFVHSKNKTFKGDSKKKRIKRALGAYYSQKNEEVDEVKEAFLDDVDKHGDEIENRTGKDKLNYIKGVPTKHLQHLHAFNMGHDPDAPLEDTRLIHNELKRRNAHNYSYDDVDKNAMANESVNENDIQGEIEDHLDNCCHDSGHIKKEVPGATDQMIRNMKKKRSSERKYYKEETSSYKSLESVIREIATQKLHN